MNARLYDMNKSFVYEGRAEYDKEAKTIYLRGNKTDMDNIAGLEGDCLIHYTDDSQGVFDFYCQYDGYNQDGLYYDMIFRIEELIQSTQRRQDLKMKTNIPIKLTLVDQDDKVMTDPQTMRAITIPAMLRDISAGGIMIDTEIELRVNQKIYFPFDKGSSPIMVPVIVLREQDSSTNYHRYGCRFYNMNSGKEAIIREYVFRLESARNYSSR